MGALVKAVLACAAVVLVGVWAVSSHTASLNAAAGVDVLGPFGPTSDVASQPSDSVCIEARVERFHWHFRYPGRDGLLGTGDDVSVADELHLPQGVAVELSLESSDYLVIWDSPELSEKAMAVPGLPQTVRLTADRSGQFDVMTDPMCGWSFFHDDVLARVFVLATDDFNLWCKQSFEADRFGRGKT